MIEPPAPAETEALERWAICADTNKPIKALAAAVIFQAKRDAKRDPEALEWLLSEGSHLWFDVLGIHPDKIAAWVKRNCKPAKPKKRGAWWKAYQAPVPARTRTNAPRKP